MKPTTSGAALIAVSVENPASELKDVDLKAHPRAGGGLKMKEGICTKSETPLVAGGRAAQAAESAAAARGNLDPDGLSRQSGPMKQFFNLLAAGGGDMQIASDPSTVRRAPELVTAAEPQLGLRLERVRTPRDFIVIDAVERPAPN